MALEDCYPLHMQNPYQLMPSLSDDEFQALKADIQRRGVLIPIEFDEEGNLLDGHHRLRACQELGITAYPTVVREGWSELDKRSHARSINMNRRHLTNEQKRQIIREELLDRPDDANVMIAQRLGVSDMTVAKIRKQLGLERDVVIGRDGRSHPSKVFRELDESFPTEFHCPKCGHEWNGSPR